MIVPFAVQSYRHDSLPISAQRVLNLYAEKHPPGAAKSQVTVHGAPGISSFATVAAGPIRGMILFGGLLYVVSGNFLYSVTNDSVPVVTQLGGQISGTGVVEMADNGVQIGIVNGSQGYIYSTSLGLQLITSTAFNPAQTIAYMNDLFVFDWATTAKFFISALLDGTTYDATQFATAESHSDNVLSVHNLKQVLYLLKERSMELWQNTGAVNFPFARIPGGVVDRGIIGNHARTQEDQGLFFVGNDRIAYRIDAMQPMRNSTHPIEQAWQKYATVSDCIGMHYTWNGHKFVVFTFPSVGASWSFDIATGYWHERDSRDANGNSLGRWRVNAICEAYGKTIVGDFYTGQLGFLDGTVTTEWGNQIVAQAASPVYHANRKRAFQSLFELDMETGVGVTSGQGSDPQVMLDISDDGGRTWGDQQYWQSIGKIGAYTTRVRWKRLGNFFQRVMRITISDPVRRTIIAANAEIKVGM